LVGFCLVLVAAQLKNPAASCEEKAKDIMICAKRYYFSLMNEVAKKTGF
jgi:hypothetical protein